MTEGAATDEKLHDFHVLFGRQPRGPDEMEIRTRSVIRILTYLSLTVEVPVEHIKDGRAPDLAEFPVGPHPKFTAHGGPKRPAECHGAVPYEGHWFWIDHAPTRSPGEYQPVPLDQREPSEPRKITG